MTVIEKIIKRVMALPDSAQAEILAYIEYLESRVGNTNNERLDWSDLSLSQAMHGMEFEKSQYSLDDIKEKL